MAGVVRLKKGRISLVLDIRYPVNNGKQPVYDKAAGEGKTGGDNRITAVQDFPRPITGIKKDPLVTVLMNA